jgi:D-alanine--poly(phosphoribitol) ligase subunit 2
MMTSTVSDKVLELLAAVAETDEVRVNLELALYERHVLDSMKTVELMVALEEEFGLKISPAEFDREDWLTPRKIIADVERRLHA